MDWEASQYVFLNNLGLWDLCQMIAFWEAWTQIWQVLFVGYPKETKEYYFYHPLENKVFVSQTSVFLEK